MSQPSRTSYTPLRIRNKNTEISRRARRSHYSPPSVGCWYAPSLIVPAGVQDVRYRNIPRRDGLSTNSRFLVPENKDEGLPYYKTPSKRFCYLLKRVGGAFLRCKQVNPLGFKNDVIEDTKAIATAVCKLEGSG